MPFKIKLSAVLSYSGPPDDPQSSSATKSKPAKEGGVNPPRSKSPKATEAAKTPIPATGKSTKEAAAAAAEGGKPKDYGSPVFLHCEYQLLPGDAEPIKADVVYAGTGVKVAMEGRDPLSLEGWDSGNTFWASWTHR